MPEVSPLQGNDPRSVGAYALLGRLAVGGQGVVYLGRAGSGPLVAVKLLHDGWAASPQGRSSLQREVDAARRVAAFCTAQVLDAQLTTDPQYIVSEFVDGPSLSRYVAEHGPLGGPALDRLAVSTATGLVAIHEAGVVHRDLKPDNILIGPDGPRVIGFGIAQDTTAEVTQTASLRGTPLYLAPEQFDGRPASLASDVFAWGATMAFAATGRAAFAAPTFPAVMVRVVAGEADLVGVPEPLLTLLRSCLAVDPARRPTAEQVLMSLLGRFAQPVPPPASPEMPTLMRAPLPPANWPAPAPPAGSWPAPAWSGQAAAVPQPPARRGVPLSVVVVGAVVAVVLAVAGATVVSNRGWLGTTPVAATSDGPTPSTSLSATSMPSATSVPSATLSSDAPAVLPTTTPPVVQATTTPPSGVRGSGFGATARSADPTTGVPRAFAGRWTGWMDQPNGRISGWTARMSLAAGSRTGSLEAVEVGCQVRMVLTHRSPTQLTFDLRLKPGSSAVCAPNASITLSLAGQNIAAHWQDWDAQQNTATGTLTRG